MLAFFLSPIGRYLAAGIGIVALISGFALREQNKGAAKLATKIEANNAAVTSKASAAARKSVDDSAAGVRNPRYRPD